MSGILQVLDEMASVVLFGFFVRIGWELFPLLKYKYRNVFRCR